MEGTDARAALSAAYQQYGGYLFTVCRRAVDDPDLAADLAHDAWVDALRAWDRVQPIADLRWWLVAIARNRCRRYWRGRQRQTRRVGPVARYNPRLDDRHLPDGNADRLLARDAARDVRALLAGVTPAQRTALLLTAADYTQADIARRLGTSEAGVRNLVYKGRRTIRRLLDAG